jgi:hypothetical protein
LINFGGGVVDPALVDVGLRDPVVFVGEQTLIVHLLVKPLICLVGFEPSAFVIFGVRAENPIWEPGHKKFIG